MLTRNITLGYSARLVTGVTSLAVAKTLRVVAILRVAEVEAVVAVLKGVGLGR